MVQNQDLGSVIIKSHKLDFSVTNASILVLEQDPGCLLGDHEDKQTLYRVGGKCSSHSAMA